MKVRTDFRAIFLPYLLEKQDNGTWAVLNRYYRPIGTDPNVFPPPDYMENTLIPSIPNSVVAALAAEGSGSIYLYDDNSNPTRSKLNMSLYLEKLATLAMVEIHVN